MHGLTDVPLCVIGDSIVAGFGDETGRGWTGHLVAAAQAEGWMLSVSVCGLGGDTSEMVLARWDEVDRRLASWPGTPVIAGFGTNDVMLVDWAERVDAAGTTAAVRGMIDRAPAGRFLVVGPPPIGEEEFDERIAARSEVIGAVCAEAGVPFVPTFDALRAGEVWARSVADRDGIHPGAAGYEELAGVVSGPVVEWLRVIVNSSWPASP